MAPTPPPRSRRNPVADRSRMPSLRKLRPEIVPLRTAPRGPRLVRLAMWGALGAGPLALAATFFAPQTAVVAAVPAPHPAEARTPADPRGAAELFVASTRRPTRAVPVACFPLRQDVHHQRHHLRGRGRVAPRFSEDGSRQEWQLFTPGGNKK